MAESIISIIDGSYLLPSERLTPSNLFKLRQYSADMQKISDYMTVVQAAMYNYQQGYTTKIVLNPTDLQNYIASIREVTLRIGGGYAADGKTYVEPLAASIIPDILTTLRANQLTLCQLYALYIDTQGTLLSDIDDTLQEEATDGGDVV